jgi:hypothetical protein
VAVRNGNYILNTSGSDTALIGVTAVETFYTSLIAKLKENATPELTEKLNGAEFEIVKSIQEIKAQWQLAA